MVADRRVEAPQSIHPVRRMPIGQHDRVCGRQPGHAVRSAAVAFVELVRSLAICRSVLGDGLIVGRGRAAAAVAEQHDLGHSDALEVVDTGADVLGDQFPIDEGFVVVEPRVHAQDRQAPLRELGAAGVVQIVRRAMDDDDADMRAWIRIGPIKHGLHAVCQTRDPRRALS